MNAGTICVAHLVRHANGVAVFKTFIDSYRRSDAGVPHELLLIFKGFPAGAKLADYDEHLQGIPHRRMFVGDTGFDIGPYMQVAREQPHHYFVFFNSFSRFVVNGWLEYLFRPIQDPGIGIVGATGSWQSNASDYHALAHETRWTLPLYTRVLLPVYRYVRYNVLIRGRYPDFPNYHVRTNAFIARGEVMRGLRLGRLFRKWHAYEFESSTNGMTHQILSAGLKALVAGADGRAYEPPEWADARTYWISRQENLIVSDNQTRTYDEGTAELRERFAFHAWRRYPDGRPRSDVPLRPAPAVYLAASQAARQGRR